MSFDKEELSNYLTNFLETQCEILNTVINDRIGLFKTDEKGNCIYVDPFWMDIVGINHRVDALGDKWLDYVHPDDHEKIKESWFHYIENNGNKTKVAEFRFVRPDGETVWVKGFAAAVEVDGEIIGAVGAIIDVTRKMNAIHELKELKKEFKELHEKL